MGLEEGKTQVTSHACTAFNAAASQVAITSGTTTLCHMPCYIDTLAEPLGKWECYRWRLCIKCVTCCLVGGVHLGVVLHSCMAPILFLLLQCFH